MFLGVGKVAAVVVVLAQRVRMLLLQHRQEVDLVVWVFVLRLLDQDIL